MTLPLDTAPGPSPDEEAARNAQISRELLRNARLELANGDLLQASEKAWGAAAYAVKAVAEKRRWFNEADWKLGRVADIVAEETGDDDIGAYYLVARDSHYNFYHHEYDAPSVRRAVDLTGRLIDKLNATLSADYAPPYVSETVEAMKRSLERPTSDLDGQRIARGRKPIAERPPVIPPTPESSPDNDAAQG